MEKFEFLSMAFLRRLGEFCEKLTRIHIPIGCPLLAQ